MKDQALTIALASLFFCGFVISFFGFLIFYFKKFYKMNAEKKQMQLLFENELSNTQLEIQEQIFGSISQEIHDNVGQILSLVNVQLNIIDERETTDKILLNDARENVSKAMTDLRDIAKGLNGDRIHIMGLISAVEQETQRINRIGIVRIHLEVQGEEQKINNQKELILFRVIQECLQNIIKHASASLVKIIFTYSADALEICITDNGKGFIFKQEKREHQGLGIRNIFKRTEMIGGHAEISSLPGEGTTVKINTQYV
jgi:hypothetical protein